MLQRDTCEHGRPECDCPTSTHLRKRAEAESVGTLPLNLRVAFEHDFVRLEQQTRAAHAFFQAGMFDEAVQWLLEIINVSRGLRAALDPCEHEWRIGEDGNPYCARECSAAQLR